MNKPLCLELDEAQNELDSAIEQISKAHGLPCYLLEPLVSNVLSRLQNGKRKELANARLSYERSAQEDERNNDNG